MTAPKRMLLAFGCILLAIFFLAAITIIPFYFRYGSRHTLPALQMFPVYFLFAFPGWLIALPFIFIFPDAEGRRAWLILTIGTAIGPAFIVTWTLLASGGHMTWQADGFAVMLSLAIAFLTTSFYVILLLLLNRRGHDTLAVLHKPTGEDNLGKALQWAQTHPPDDSNVNDLMIRLRDAE